MAWPEPADRREAIRVYKDSCPAPWTSSSPGVGRHLAAAARTTSRVGKGVPLAVLICIVPYHTCSCYLQSQMAMLAHPDTTPITTSTRASSPSRVEGLTVLVPAFCTCRGLEAPKLYLYKFRVKKLLSKKGQICSKVPLYMGLPL